MKTMAMSILIVTACAEDPTMFAAPVDAGDTTRQNIDSFQASIDTDTAELEGPDTDTAELEGPDTDTAELEGPDTDTAELEGPDTDTGPPWVCDFNGEGCENWQQCVTDTISICPLSPDPVPISAETYGIYWLICKNDTCPTTLYHRDCRNVTVIGTRCVP